MARVAAFAMAAPRVRRLAFRTISQIGIGYRDEPAVANAGRLAARRAAGGRPVPVAAARVRGRRPARGPVREARRHALQPARHRPAGPRRRAGGIPRPGGPARGAAHARERSGAAGGVDHRAGVLPAASRRPHGAGRLAVQRDRRAALVRRQPRARPRRGPLRDIVSSRCRPRGPYRYHGWVLEALARHGARPTAATPPERSTISSTTCIATSCGGCGRRCWRARFPKPEYYGRVVALRRAVSAAVAQAAAVGRREGWRGRGSRQVS